MSELQFAKGALRAGIWYGDFTGGDAAPSLDVRHLDQSIPDVSVSQVDGQWRVTVPVPKDTISDGVQVFSVFDKADETVLTSFTLVAGEVLGDDIRAEVELLRAELDMLKRAFRRHCVETA